MGATAASAGASGAAAGGSAGASSGAAAGTGAETGGSAGALPGGSAPSGTGSSVVAGGLSSLFSIVSGYLAQQFNKQIIGMQADSARFSLASQRRAAENEISNITRRAELDTMSFDMNFGQNMSEQVMAYAKQGITLATGSGKAAVAANVRMGQMQRELIAESANEQALTMKLAMIEADYQTAMVSVNEDFQKTLNRRKANINAGNTVAQFGLSFLGGK